LLESLYDGAMNPERWPRFLGQLATRFDGGTASLRITDIEKPRVYTSFTQGFDAEADRRYMEESVAVDLFRDALSAAPLGTTLASHEIVSDREFERSAHYQMVFRPNGNFYAMGAQFERQASRAAHIGVHRPRRAGPFSRSEQRELDIFYPHLKRAARMMQLMGEFEVALGQARAALDCLPYGVWLVDRQRRCQWSNAVAEEAMQTHVYGLGLSGDRLQLRDAMEESRWRSVSDRVSRGEISADVMPLGHSGATLVAMQYRRPSARALMGPEQEALLVFLLDPERPVKPNAQRLHTLYGLTQAEIRLLGELLRGYELSEISACLNLSIHTVRAQLKSVMRKVGVTRQAQLIRKLLMVCAALPSDGDAH
jgi:DNA-binding CsgD family transcriptional regulator